MPVERTTERPDSPAYDVIVVGARCAGAATALLVARRGLRVLLVDRGRYGTDTLSTHALMRAGVLQLHRWGVLDGVRAAGTPTVRTTAFHYGDDVVEIPIKPQDGVDGLYAPRRKVIDSLLVDAARREGAEVVYETRLAELSRASDGRVRGVRLEGPNGAESQVATNLVVGADGVHSTVARLVGAEEYKTGNHASGVVFSYWADTGLEGYHWCYRPGVSVGAIPTNEGQACIFVSVPHARFQTDLVSDDIGRAYHRLLERCNPGLGSVVGRATRTEKYRGFPGRFGFLRQSYGPGWALVGDAGYFKDPLTAHGMTDALVDAEVLADAVAEGTEDALANYQRTRDDRAVGLFEITDAIASYEWDLEGVARMHRAFSDEMKKDMMGIATPSRDESRGAR